jgi:hypothetical protein
MKKKDTTLSEQFHHQTSNRRYQTGNQKPQIEGQTIQWPKEKKDKRINNDRQNTTQKTKDRSLDYNK